MGKAMPTPPLICQSKPLCFSCLYLLTSLFLALYLSLSSTKCIFRSSPFDPIQSPLFSYPSSYAQHKHSLPTLRSSCSSPVFFSEYWAVLKEIRESYRNWGSSSSLTYVREEADSFGGNFSTQKRISFFNHEGGGEVACGFMKPFPVSKYDQIAMEECNEVVVVSAIFGDHDKIRQPRGIGSKTLDVVCFFMFVDDLTLRGLLHHSLISEQFDEHKIGAWRLVNVSVDRLYSNPAMNGVIPKYFVHRLFPNAKYSIWVDAKLQLVVDPLLLIHSLVIKENVDMAISRHPFFTHTMEEAMATARWRKWLDIQALKTQMETYCENGLRPWSHNKLPYPSDVPDSALILRRHGAASNLFSCLMFNELEAFNPRDQLAFAFVRDKMNPKIIINMFEVEVFEQIALEYRHNTKSGGPNGTQPGPKTRRVHPDLSLSGAGTGKCEKYFLEMRGELHGN
ncbi:Alkaline ceramidase tod1 [Ancistrocladus abbreviatus]